MVRASIPQVQHYIFSDGHLKSAGTTLEIRGYHIAVACTDTLPARRSRTPPEPILCSMQRVQKHINIEAPASLVWDSTR